MKRAAEKDRHSPRAQSTIQAIEALNVTASADERARVLRTCLELLNDSSASNADASDQVRLPEALDCLQRWLDSYAALCKGNSAAPTPAECGLTEAAQDALVPHIWAHLVSPQKDLASRSTLALSALLQILPIEAQGSSSRGSKLVEEMLGRALDLPDYKVSMTFFELMLSSGDAQAWYLLDAAPKLYERYVLDSDANRFNAGRRSKLACSLLRAEARRLDIQFNQNGVAQITSDAKSQAAFKAWSLICVPTLARALLDDDARGRHQLGHYHVAGVIDIAPETLPILLEHINAQGSSPATLPAVLTVLRAGRAAALCRIVDGDATKLPTDARIIYDIPVEPLLSCAAASSLELHTLTLAVVVTSRAPIAPLERTELDVLRKYFSHNLSINNSEARTTVRSLLSRLLDRLRASCFAANRDATKLERIAAHERTEDEEARLQAYKSTLAESHGFLEWLAAEASRLIYVGSPYFAIIAGLNLLDILLPVEAASTKKSRKPAGQALAYDFKLDLATPELVQRLLACANSSFVATQAAAFKLLTRFPAPLPGLESREAAEAAILDKAARFMLGARESESNAAGELSSLYLRIYVIRCGWSVRPFAGTASALNGQVTFAQPEHAFIAEHLSLLESHLAYAEASEAALLSAAHTRPLHGTLVALQALFAAVDTRVAAERLAELRALYARTVVAIDRVWKLTSSVLCASAPEGANPTAAPDHETARALAAAGEEDGDVGTVLGPAHQVLLSYAWRGMKESSALLGQIVAHGLASGDVARCQALWSIEELEGVGVRFTEWMTRVRHRGAFSTIGPSYALAAGALVRCKSWPEAADKPRAWINSFLNAVEDPAKSLSITRRSAGIGYAVLALLSAFSEDDSEAIDATMQRLMGLAAAEVPPSKAAQIHAMNIIRVCVLDGGLAAALAPFIGPLLALVVKRFSSQDWNIRNSSMMLFSSLLARALPGKMTNLSLTAERVPMHQFFTRFPTLHSALLEQLGTLSEAASSQRSGSDLGDGQSALFAVLLLLSRMQAMDHVPQTNAYADPFKPLIESCMDSPVWKLREVAADAFASVIQPSQALSAGAELLQRCSLKQQNGAHGRLLAVERLLCTAHKPNASDISSFHAAYSAASSTWLSQNKCPATQAAFLAIGIALAQPEVNLKALTTAEAFSRATLDASKTDSLRSLLQVSAGPALLVACARFQLLASSNPSAATRALVAHACPDVRLEAIQHVADDASIAHGNELSSPLLKVFCSSEERSWIRAAAGHTLHRRFRRELLTVEDRQTLWRQVTEIAASNECAPLRQAALPLLADLAAVREEGQMTTEQIQAIDTCCRAAAIGAREIQPVELRAAALQALSSLRALLFPAALGALDSTTAGPALFDARVAFISLLADDNESTRHFAADALAEALGAINGDADQKADAGPLGKALDAAKQISLGSAASIDHAWAWMKNAYSSAGSQAWNEHVWSLLFVDEQTVQRDFDAAFSSSAALFAEDGPNQFRQPSEDLIRAGKFLASIRAVKSKATLCSELLNQCSILQRIIDALQLSAKDATASHEPVATHTLALRTILASQALTQLLNSAQLDDDQAASLDKAKVLSSNIARQLQIEMAGTASDKDSSAKGLQSPVRRMRIAMISDFFYPNVGGVEGHMYMLSQRLLQRGHKVIVITHAYSPDRTGIRHLPSGLKVYHIPYGVIARQDTLPQFFGLFPPLRSILLRERIEIVHGHQALSSMAHEGILHARAMGIRAVFTDHSLFGFADAASILTNKLLRFVLSDIDQVVCVSHIGKENTVLRAAIDPRKVSVIPNAVVASQFRPDPTKPDPTRLTIVVLSRLMYRKGIDLLIASIPRICERHPDVHFVIGGDGPKRIELEQMREKYFLHERVELAGAIRPGDVREHLVRGQIFLNTSLTEAFGTSIIEAACAGLFVVSTRVGGVPEVLPPWMSLLAAPDEDDVVRATEEAIAHIRGGKHDPIKYHEAVKSMYSWADVAERVEEVYDSAFDKPIPDSLDRFRSYYAGGPIAGKIFCIIVAVDMIFLFLLEWMMPAASIDCVPDVIDACEERQ